MKRVLAFALAVVAVSTLPGCLAPDGATLTILDQGSFPQFDAVKDEFKNRTGATLVKIDGGDAGNALRTALLGAGNPPADILFGVDNALFFTSELREKRLFVPYESPNLDRIDRDVIDIDVFRVDGELWATPVEHGYVAVNYDARLTETTSDDRLPHTLRDLATARWGPEFVTEDPRFSSPGLGFFLATVDTFPEGSAYDWKHYWRDLLTNGTKVANDWTEAYVYHYSGGYGQGDEQNLGDRSIVVSYTTSPAAEILFSPDPISPPGVSLEPAGGVFHQVETMGILRGSKNVDLAKQFIDFMLLDEFQQHNAPLNAVYPVTAGVELPAAIYEHATPPVELDPADLSPFELQSNLERWLTEWETLYRAETA